MQQSTTANPTWNSAPRAGFTWGMEDATAGTDRRGSFYFSMGTQDYADYNKGYDCGIRSRLQSQAITTAAAAAANNRCGRAMALVASGAVKRNGNGYTVASQSNGATYRTTATTCTCPDATYNGKTCKHSLAVRMVQRMSELDSLNADLEAFRSAPTVYMTDAQLEAADNEPMYTSWQG